jgi:hypothetical protein
VDVFQVPQERGTGIPRGAGGGGDDVVAVERAHRDEDDVGQPEAREKGFKLGTDLAEARFAPVDQIHFVDRDHHMRNAQQPGDAGVAAALLDDSGARIDEDDREVGRGGPGHHVAGVLDVPRGVGHDEAAAGRGEVAVGDVDGDALLAFGAQPVGEVGEVDLAAAGDGGGAFERLELVLHDRL